MAAAVKREDGPAALELYKQLRSTDGCFPNVVTFTILIKVAFPRCLCKYDR